MRGGVNLPQFVYLRELDLEKLNRATVEKLAKLKKLKKLIVHGCRNFDALQDFRNLPQLLVVKGEIVGLKVGEINGVQRRNYLHQPHLPSIPHPRR